MNDLNNSNGLNGGAPALPDDKRAAVEYGLTQWQHMMHDRDEAKAENARLKTDMAGYKVAIEAQASQLAGMESRMADLVIQRDDAVSRRAQVETVLESVAAMLRTFKIGNVPLIKIDEPMP